MASLEDEPVPLPLKICANCRFYHSDDVVGIPPTAYGGECRRYAPSIAGRQHLAVWPRVIALDWCGMYQSAEMGHADPLG